MNFSPKTKQFILDFKLELVLSLIIFGMILNLIIQTTFILPSFKNIFEGHGSLPLLTRMLLAASEFFQSYFILLLPVILGVLYIPVSGIRIRNYSPERYEECQLTFFIKQFGLLFFLFIMHGVYIKAVFLPMLSLIN